MSFGKLHVTLRMQKSWVDSMNKINTNIKQHVSLQGLEPLESSLNRVVDDAVPEYQKPVLTAYGDVRDVTLGPTPGLGESGCECARRDGGGACDVVCPPI